MTIVSKFFEIFKTISINKLSSFFFDVNCEILNLNFVIVRIFEMKLVRFEKLHLYFWQMIATTWIFLLLKSFLNATLLIDNSKIDKTIFVFYVLRQYLKFRDERLSNLKRHLKTFFANRIIIVHRFNLIVNFNETIDVWQKKFKKFFSNFVLRKYLNIKTKTIEKNQKIILFHRIENFQTWFQIFNIIDSRTSRIIIFIIFTIWYRRIVRVMKTINSTNVKNDNEKNLTTKNDLNKSNTKMKTLKIEKNTRNRVKNFFEMIIVDETHKLKFRQFKTYYSIASFVVDKIVFFSKISTFNKLLNFVDFLIVMWKREWIKIEQNDESLIRLNVKNY